MILSDIKRYLRQHRQATLADLVARFDSDPDAMRAMLDLWVRKGRVSRTDLRSDCTKGCCSCQCGAAMELYTWKA